MREGFADRPSAPAIMLTGQATHEIDLEANALGVTDFLVKQELAPAKLERSIRYAISHQQAERHALAARAANDGIWDWNLEADHIYFSPRWHAILGLEERAHEYPSSMWFELVAPEDRHRLREALDAHLAGRTIAPGVRAPDAPRRRQLALGDDQRAGHPRRWTGRRCGSPARCRT